MSLHLMKTRIDAIGGEAQQDRMVAAKEWTLKRAFKNSYQAAKLQKVDGVDVQERVYDGLMNPTSQTEDYDNKLVSTLHSSEFVPGQLFYWKNTGTYWIAYLVSKTEFSHYKAHCRQCRYVLKWVDKDRQLHQTWAAVIGPNNTPLATAANVNKQLSYDTSNLTLNVLIPQNDLNAAFFQRYNEFIIMGKNYRIETVDDISMPGIRQMICGEHYVDKVHQDQEIGITNAYNVMPSDPFEIDTDWQIHGRNIIKPWEEVRYSALYWTKGESFWRILENLDSVIKIKWLPVQIVGSSLEKEVIFQWIGDKAGAFTIEYETKGKKFYKRIRVDSLL